MSTTGLTQQHHPQQHSNSNNNNKNLTNESPVNRGYLRDMSPMSLALSLAVPVGQPPPIFFVAELCLSLGL